MMNCKSLAEAGLRDSALSDPNGIRTRVTAVKGRYCIVVNSYKSTIYEYLRFLLRQKLRKTSELSVGKSKIGTKPIDNSSCLNGSRN
jgi:hypothetical protein